MTVQSSPRRRTESPTRKSRSGSSVAQGVAGLPSMLGTGRSTRLPLAATVGDGHMARKSALSSPGTSATVTTSALGHSTMAMRTRTKSHGNVSRAELRVGEELGGEVLAVAVLQIRDCYGSRRRNRYALHGRGAKADTHRIDITVYLAAGRVGRGLFLVEPPMPPCI